MPKPVPAKKDIRQDLRIVKTKRALATAMLCLLEKQPFGKITVNDLCQEALVSRSAFYAHFEDKYDLLHFCIQALKQRLFDESEGMDIQGRLQNVLENIQANVKIVRNLMMAELDAELMVMFRRTFLQDFERMLDARQIDGSTLPGPPEIMAAYFSSGVTSAIMTWVSGGMACSTGEMAACLLALLPGMMGKKDGQKADAFPLRDASR
ncbi:TetR/AcrR family transcriptional regulator [Ruminococcaceae bacterium OttesenSCG-928-A11]|nr:TetR/AcrR family transcriptional regulator [Ruminococcaceae bacterium OttesenSCG-928-A11]